MVIILKSFNCFPPCGFRVNIMFRLFNQPSASIVQKVSGVNRSGFKGLGLIEASIKSLLHN